MERASIVSGALDRSLSSARREGRVGVVGVVSSVSTSRQVGSSSSETPAI